MTDAQREWSPEATATAAVATVHNQSSLRLAPALCLLSGIASSQLSQVNPNATTLRQPSSSNVAPSPSVPVTNQLHLSAVIDSPDGVSPDAIVDEVKELLVNYAKATNNEQLGLRRSRY